MSLVTKLHTVWTNRLKKSQAQNKSLVKRKLSEDDAEEIDDTVKEGFWILPNERAFNSAYSGCSIPAGEHVETHRQWPERDDDDQVPTTTVIAYSNPGQAYPGHCDWCRGQVQDARDSSPDGRQLSETERNELERLARSPCELCPFHRHHVLTGERLTPDNVTRLEDIRLRIQRWTWAHAIYFIEARAKLLPQSHIEEHGEARVLYCSGSFHLNEVLWEMAAPRTTAIPRNPVLPAPPPAPRPVHRTVPAPRPAPRPVHRPVPAPTVDRLIRHEKILRFLTELTELTELVETRRALEATTLAIDAATDAAQQRYHQALAERIIGQLFAYHHDAIMQQRDQPESFEHAATIEWLLYNHRIIVARQEQFLRQLQRNEPRPAALQPQTTPPEVSQPMVEQLVQPNVAEAATVMGTAPARPGEPPASGEAPPGSIRHPPVNDRT